MKERRDENSLLLDKLGDTQKEEDEEKKMQENRE